MTTKEEVRQENEYLRERVGLQQEKIELQQTLLEQQETLFNQQQALIEGLHTQVGLLEEQVQALQERLKKDSHNSHLPPSSDRFHRQPKSLRKRSGKKAGGQPDHPGSTLMLSPTPDQVIVHLVECCQHCQRDLRAVESLQVDAAKYLLCRPSAWWSLNTRPNRSAAPAVSRSARRRSHRPRHRRAGGHRI